MCDWWHGHVKQTHNLHRLRETCLLEYTESSRIEWNPLAESSLFRAQGNNNNNNNNKLNFNSHHLGVENLTMEFIYVSQTSVCIAFALYFPKHYHRQYMSICESYVFVGLPILVLRLSTNGCPEGWQCSLLIPMLFTAFPGPQFDATLFGVFHTRAFHS